MRVDFVIGQSREQRVQHCTGGKRAQQLADDVAKRLAFFQPPAQGHREGDRRVDVATGHRPDDHYQHHQRETERERDTQPTGRSMAEIALQRGDCRTDEHQCEGADEFRQIGFDGLCLFHDRSCVYGLGLSTVGQCLSRGTGNMRIGWCRQADSHLKKTSRQSSRRRRCCSSARR